MIGATSRTLTRGEHVEAISVNPTISEKYTVTDSKNSAGTCDTKYALFILKNKKI
jgi:hypothetical protein